MSGRRTMLFSGVGVMVIIAVAGTLLLVPMGCQSGPAVTGTLRPTVERSRRLMAMAAEEAAAVADADTRLTRQLNLADHQVRSGWVSDARTTLAAARQTLDKDGAGLNNHARISGWVSVSELSRAARDAAGATAAVERAMAELMAIEDLAARCQYAMGLANELYELKGQKSAADLLRDAGQWTREIDDLPERRRATVAFASALFNLDEYEAGQAVLRQDDDPVWRSDTAASLALRASGQGVKSQRLTGASTVSESEGSSLYYGKRLNYRDVFQGQQKSQTTKD